MVDMDKAKQHTLLKYSSLGLLIPHTIFYTILAAIARKPNAQGNVFFGPSAVVCMEFGKLATSLLATFYRMSTESQNLTKSEEYIAIPNRSDVSPRSERLNSEVDESEKLQSRIQIDRPDVNDVSVHVPEDDDDDSFKQTTQSSGFKAVLNAVRAEIFNRSGFRLVPPAILYVFQNNLQVFAAGNLTPAEYQIVGQTKLVFTAIFSVIILRKVLNKQHWLSIAVLTIGTIVVQLVSSSQLHKVHSNIPSDAVAAANTEGIASPTILSETPKAIIRTQWNLLIGTIAMLGASACSGLGGVLVEMLLKQKLHFWTTNVFLSFFSLLPASIPVILDTFYRSSFDPLRFFNGYVWGLIGMNILGGIITSVSMKYADNILKNFAVAISLIGTVYLSVIVLGESVNFIQVVGTALVIGAVVGYARA